ncbi:hypothetical protein pclt_cds_1197 [Pandoravirus celtis]|uniref:Ankyrin repeat domain containing protein n=1 Tax=Pandoravirus celtis TaxID=2568002 RepID=A0A4D6EJ82_9VIRU|nr:hypothetical protein pclt_cds_1197 [Pandoravirus celtis]
MMTATGDGHSTCGRDWGVRPMCEAAHINNVDIMELVYKRCYWGDSEILERPLRVAAGSGATAAVEWILARYDDREAADSAFEAAFDMSRRDCAVAILSRWPDIIDTSTLFRYCVQECGDMTVSVLDAMLAVSTGAQPDPWPVSSVDASNDPGRVYDALLVHCLSDDSRTPRQFMQWLEPSSVACDAAFRWAIDNAPCAHATYVTHRMAHKGMIGRLAYCHERGLLTPDHIVAAMTGAAEAGRIHVLDHVWSGFVANTEAADAVRANVQTIAHGAARSGDWTVIEWLQKHVDQRAHCTAAAFSVAANKGHAAFLERLYAVGADRCRHECDAPCESVPGWKPFLYGLATPCGLYDVNDLWRNVARGGHYDVAQVCASMECSTGSISGARPHSTATWQSAHWMSPSTDRASVIS